jgi:hypothetical protein
LSIRQKKVLIADDHLIAMIAWATKKIVDQAKKSFDRRRSFDRDDRLGD